MPAKEIRINLLGTQDLEHTPWGRIVSWATTYGRYIMITTEIIVLLAFISRFSLDRKLTDLTEEVTQKQAIIEANSSFEREIKSLQTRLGNIKKIIMTQPRLLGIMDMVEAILPADVYLTGVEVSNDKLVANAIASTTQGFSQFLSNAGAIHELQNITVGDLTRRPLTGIEFQFTADIPGAEKKAVAN